MLLDNEEAVRALVDSLCIVDDYCKKTYAEVFTPLETVERVLNMLPPHVWSNPNLTWFEPAVGIGSFMVCIYYRLMAGLGDAIPDHKSRHRHVLRNMLFMSEINIKNINICRSIFGAEANIHHGDTMALDARRMQRLWGRTRFDVILGNPPYHHKMCVKGSTPTIYHEFVMRFVDTCHYLLFILPSRWFASGKGLQSFRRFMLSRHDIRQIQHFDNSKPVFKNGVYLMGGVQFLLKDAAFQGYCNFNGILCQLGKYDIIVDPNYQSILDKVLFNMRHNIQTICYGQTYSGIKTNDERLVSSPAPDHLLCYVSSNQGLLRYVHKRHLPKHRDFSKWKVLTVEANGYWKYFGRTIIAGPGEVCNQTYIAFEVDTLEEAVSLFTFLDTKLANFLLGLRKVSQHIKPDTCKWIPLVPLDRCYTDAMAYDLFNLSPQERLLIDELYRKSDMKRLRKNLLYSIELADKVIQCISPTKGSHSESVSTE